jgi:hypothetical protein
MAERVLTAGRILMLIFVVRGFVTDALVPVSFGLFCCAEILNMAPDSPDAQIFREYEKRQESKNSAASAGAAQAGGKQRRRFNLQKLLGRVDSW